MESPLPGEAMVRDSVGSVGLGLRCTYDKNTTIKFDLARVVDAAAAARRVTVVGRSV